jgi:peroxiredoxin family protein
VRWCASAGHELMAFSGGEQLDLVLAGPAVQPTAIVPASAGYDCVLLVMHNSLESLLGALLVANTAAAQGMRTMIFFTFWGLNLLRADRPSDEIPAEPVSFMQRMFKWMMPKGPRRQNLGQLNFGGAGAAIMQGIMRRKNIQDLPALLASAEEQGVSFVACTMSMAVMGITQRELTPHRTLVFGGVATFVDAGRTAKLSLVF